MACEKEGYRDALERIRHEAAGELMIVSTLDTKRS